MHATMRLPLSAAIGAALLATLASPVDAQTITRAPAFNAERLSTLPRDEWITNGGTIANQRYSPLDLINRGNVAGLKGLWRTGLESGTHGWTARVWTAVALPATERCWPPAIPALQTAASRAT